MCEYNLGASQVSFPKLTVLYQAVGLQICGLSLHLGTSESRKTLEQKFSFQIGTLNPIGINERFWFY